MSSIIVCGNLTLDEIVDGSRISVSPGGSALFASAAASYVGSHVTIMGNIGEDYPQSNLRSLKTHGVDLQYLKTARGPTTRFRITQHNGHRRLSVIDKGASIQKPRKFKQVQGTHLGPVFNEISTSHAASLRAHCEFLSADLQGFIRTADRSGLVRTKKKRLGGLLRMCDVVQGSIEEAQSQSPKGGRDQLVRQFLDAGPQYCVLTLGREGSIIGVKPDHCYMVPAFPDKSITDTTGAGDVFAGSWLATYLSTRDPVWAAAVGSAFASLASRKRGLSKFGFAKTELLRRARWIYDRVRPVSG